MRLLSDNKFLSVSVQLLPKSGYSGFDGIKSGDFTKVLILVSEIIQTISTKAVSQCYKYTSIKKHYTSIFYPGDINKGIVTYYLTFNSDDNYQRSLLLDNTQCNSALLDYIKSAFNALYAEEIAASTDLNLPYVQSNTLEPIVSIKNNRLYYNIKTFPSFVKSLADKLKKLRKLNPDYNLLICNQSDHFFATTIETCLTPEKRFTGNLLEVTGKVMPAFTSGSLTHYTFIDYFTSKEYILLTNVENKDPRQLKDEHTTLNRTASNIDYIKLIVTPIQYNERGKDLTINTLKLDEIITKTRESREELGATLKGLFKS